MSNEKEIAKALALMFATYEREPKRDVIMVYVSLLKKYDLLSIRKAISKAVDESEYCPRPATILKHLKPTQDDLQSRATTEAARVVESIRRDNTDCLKGDKLTTYLMNSRWNLKILQDTMLESEIKWFIKEFIESYISFSKSKIIEQIKESDVLSQGSSHSLVNDLTSKLTIAKVENE